MLVVGSVLIVALVIALPLYALYVIYRPAVRLCVLFLVDESLLFFPTENDSVFQCSHTWLEGGAYLFMVQCMGHMEESVVCWGKSVHLCYHSVSGSCKFNNILLLIWPFRLSAVHIVGLPCWANDYNKVNDDKILQMFLTVKLVLFVSTPPTSVVHPLSVDHLVPVCAVLCEALQEVPHQFNGNGSPPLSVWGNRLHPWWERPLRGASRLCYFHSHPISLWVTLHHVQSLKKDNHCLLVLGRGRGEGSWGEADPCVVLLVIVGVVQSFADTTQLPLTPTFAKPGSSLKLFGLFGLVV